MIHYDCSVDILPYCKARKGSVSACLKPDDFTHQGKSAATQWVNQTICQSINNPVSGNMPWCTLLYHFILSVQITTNCKQLTIRNIDVLGFFQMFNFQLSDRLLKTAIKNPLLLYSRHITFIIRHPWFTAKFIENNEIIKFIFLNNVWTMEIMNTCECEPISDSGQHINANYSN